MVQISSENQVKNSIIEFLIYSGFLVLRVNSGAFSDEHNGKRRFVSFVKWFCRGSEAQTAGISDILAFHPSFGREGKPLALAVETKRPGKVANVSEAQKRFLSAWTEHGGYWVVAESIDDVIRGLSQ